MKLGGQTIPTPKQNISINYIEIARSERTVTATMVKDIIAHKRQFSIPYSGLKPTEAQIFIGAYEAGEPVLFEYEDVQGAQTAIVYVMGLPREIYSYKPNYTQNITITLEEQ
jgi:hypothetical protein